MRWLTEVNTEVMAALKALGSLSYLIGYCYGIPLGGLLAIAVYTFRSSVLPGLLGLIPFLAILASEHLSAWPIWRRLFYTGRGAQAGWIGTIDLHPHTRPKPGRLE